MNAVDLVGIAVGVDNARARIRAHVRETPVVEAPALSRELDATILLKLENLQPTGSFKVRGAFNKLLSLTAEQRAAGVVTASSGNHGLAMAYAATGAKVDLTVVVPETVSPAKLTAIKRFPVEVLLQGPESGEAERHARDLARRSGRVYVSPYNDPEVMRGQGTIAAELHRQVGRVDNLFVSVGGGGLIAGIGAWLRRNQPNVRVFACSAANSCGLAESLQAGRVIETLHKPTYADALAGDVEADSITLPVCQKVIDESLICTEEEIESALVTILTQEHQLVEGAAAITLAGARKAVDQLKNRVSDLLICGANISGPTLATALRGQRVQPAPLM
jgi:threonine dehydratase